MTDYPDLLPWQEEVLKKFQAGSEYKIVSAGRQTGKSWVNSIMQQHMDNLVGRPIRKLICSTGTIFGHDYVTVEPRGGSWCEMEQWCIDTYGPESKIWEMFKDQNQPGRWYTHEDAFWFSDPRDCEWFILKWTPNG
jgi:hypothetical protein